MLIIYCDGLHRFCRLLSEFYGTFGYYETTNGKNGLSSSSLAFSSHGGEKKSNHVFSMPTEDACSGTSL